MEPSQAANIRYGNHGETICTDATWTTLVSFILLNYVMHAFTVMPAPGAGSGRKSFWVILCLFIPTLGVFAAFKRIGSGLAFLQSRLENASRNEALCMIVGIGEDGICVVPTAFAEAKISKKELTSLFRDSARVHGCHPAMQAAPVHFRDSAQQPVRFHDRIFDYFHSLFQHRPENTGEVEYRIILVRHGLPIHPLWDGVDYRDMEIARSYSFVRGISAIAQIFFAIKALYGARGDQIDRYGYAAFGVTVIPYLWMSVLNLIAAIMQPQYPYMYLLHYRNAECLCTNVPIPIPKDEEKGKEPAVEMRELDTPKPDVQERDTGQEKARRKNAELDQALQDKVLGAVGVVHASPKDLIDRGPAMPFVRALIYSCWGCLGPISTPYSITNALTGFEAARSTPIQRFSVIGWFALGHVLSFCMVLMHHLRREVSRKHLLMMIVLLFPVGVFSLMNVSKMILESGDCIKL